MDTLTEQLEMLRLFRRQKILTASEYERASKRAKAEEAKKIEAGRQRLQARVEAIRVAQEKRRIAARAAEIQRAAEVKKAEQRVKRTAATARRGVRVSLLNYPALTNAQLRDANVDDVRGGFITQWVARIPAKRFSIIIRAGSLQKVISKMDDSSNEDWWQGKQVFWEVMAASDETIFQANRSRRDNSMTVAPMSDVAPKKQIQRAREGMEHCIFSPLRNFYLHKREQSKSKTEQKRLGSYAKACEELSIKYDDGISFEDLRNETEGMRTTIVIWRVDQQEKRVLNPGKMMSFQFINSRWNHCDVWMPDSDALELTPLEMRSKIEELTAEGIPFSYESNKSKVRSLQTQGQKYRVKTPYEDIFNEFNKEIDRNAIGVDFVKNPDLFNYIQQAFKHNTHMRFQENCNGMKEQDIRAAYTQFQHAPEFQGFMGAVWSWCKPSGLADLEKHIGIYTVRVLETTKLFDKIGFSVGSVVTLCSPEILFLCKNGLSVDVLYGVHGSRFYFEFPESMLQKYDETTGELGSGVPLYSMWTGGTAAASDHRVIRRNIDYRLVQDLRSTGIEIQWEYAEECFEYLENCRVLKPEILEMENPPGCSVQFIPKATSVNCPQIFAFVTSYTRMLMLEQMLKMNVDDLVCWKLDSLVYVDKGQTFSDVFRPKPVKNNFKMMREIYRESEIVKFNKGDLHPPMDRAVLFAGAGGSGKSHFASKLLNLLYVAPMWSICADFRNKYKRIVMTPQQVLGVGCRSYFETVPWRPANVFVDESTMIDETTKQRLLDAFPHARVIFGGDFDSLGRPYQTTFQNVMGIEGLSVKEFLNDYRSKEGDALVDVKKGIREFMSKNYGNSQALASYVLSLLKNRIVTVDQVPEMYSVEDWILCGTNALVEEWTQKLPGDKFLTVKHSQADIRDALAGKDVALNGDVVFVDNGRCERRHAFTIHSVQGKTVESRVFVDMRRVDFDFCLLYTAISRARSLDQIFLVVE